MPIFLFFLRDKSSGVRAGVRKGKHMDPPAREVAVSRQEALELIDKLDLNGDGKLSKSEKAVVEARFEALEATTDVNGDGRVSGHEALDLNGDGRVTKSEKDELDANGDGAISKLEADP